MEKWEEDIFEGRNKLYGSYQLRKKYNKVLLYSFVIATILFFSPIFFLYYQYQKKVSMDEMPVTVTIDLTHPMDIDELLSEPPPPPESPKKDIVEKLPSVIDSSKEKSMTDAKDQRLSLDDSLSEKEKVSNSNSSKDENDTSSFIFVDELPQFIGGNNEFVNFVRKNLIIPETVIKKKIKGKVIIQIYISKTGDVLKVSLISGIDAALDSEALRVVSLTKKWIPAKRAGKAIPFKLNIPIKL